MKRLLRTAAVIVFAALSASSAGAQTLEKTVGSALIKFPIPKGQCEISDRITAEAAFNQRMRRYADSEIIFLIHANCTELQGLEARRGSLNEYAVYSAKTSEINAFVTPESHSRACAATKADETADGKPLGNLEIDGIKIAQPRSLGVLLYENNACYTAVLARVASSNGLDGPYVGIFATVLIKGKIVLYKFFGPFSDSRSIDSLDRHKKNVDAFIAANEDKL